MKTLNVIFVLNLILLLITLFLFWRIFFKKYLESYSKLVSFILICSMLSCIFFCVAGMLSYVLGTTKITDFQEFYGRYESNRAFIQNTINSYIQQSTLYLIKSLITFSIIIACRLSIIKYHKVSFRKNKLWDWNKIRRNLNSN